VEVLNDRVRGAQLLPKGAGVTIPLVVSDRRLQPSELAAKFSDRVTFRKRFAQVVKRFGATFELRQELPIHCRQH
jgi:hypothetical protein